MAFTVCSPDCQMTPRLCGLEQQQSFILPLFAMQMNSRAGSSLLPVLQISKLTFSLGWQTHPAFGCSLWGILARILTFLTMDLLHSLCFPTPWRLSSISKCPRVCFPVIHLYAHKTAHQTFCWCLRGSLALEANLLKSQNIRIKCTSLGNPRNAQIAFISHSGTFLIFSVVFNILVCFNSSEMHRRQGTVFYYNHVWHN